MNKIKLSLLALALLMVGTGARAQLDERNRTVETVIADGLQNLPTQSHKKYAQVIGEMAGTGSRGIELLAQNLKPQGEGVENAKFEYAINSIVDYAMEPGHEDLRDGIRTGVVSAMEKCEDKTNKAFLMGQLQKCGTASEVDLLAGYLGDNDLQDAAMRALSGLEGEECDAAIVKVVKESGAEERLLAEIAYQRELEGVEPELLKWATGTSDTETLKAVYAAMSVCGGEESLALLGELSEEANYGTEETSVTLRYLELLDRVGTKTEMSKTGKKMMKSGESGVRCAGLRLVLKGNEEKAQKEILKALNDDDRQVRVTALDLAETYGGNGIESVVAQKYSKVDDEAKVDIVRWLGVREAKSEIDVVKDAIEDNGNSGDELALAGIEAAGKIGGNDALEALVDALEGNYGDAAKSALLAFNGDVNDGIVEALDSENKETVKRALAIASEREIHEAYDKVKGLTGSNDEDVSKAAYDALGGVARSENFGEIADMLETSSGGKTASLQKAAGMSIERESASGRYEMIEKRMEESGKRQLYYPLLAEVGNDEALESLKKEYNTGEKEAAMDALEKIDNEDVIGTLYELATENPAKKDALLNRALTLTKKSKKTNEQKYLLYRKTLDMEPGEKLTGKVLSAMGDTKTRQAMVSAREYLNDDNTKVAAATAIKSIVSKNASLQGGTFNRTALKEAQEVFRTEKDDADAGYAVDEINGLLEKMEENGYEEVADFEKGKDYENFEIVLDWLAKGNGTLNLRNMPAVKMDGEKVAMAFGEVETKVNAGDWNTLYVKMVDDRITVKVNGELLANNAVMENTNGKGSVNATGKISLEKDGEGLELRQIAIKELPSTPVFTLSEEEKKAGFEVLFDGRSLENWQGNTTGYVPMEGTIYVTANYGGEGNLYTKKKYRDFIYRFEFCFVKNGVNNGIGLRTNIGTDAAYDGMEIQVLDHDDPIYANLAPYQQHGGVYGVIVPKHVTFGELGTWNTEEIRLIGDEIRVTVNGEVVTEGNIREACQGHNVAPDGGETNPYMVDHKNHPGLFNTEGYISFCGHGAGIKFRNIRILDLSGKK